MTPREDGGGRPLAMELDRVTRRFGRRWALRGVTMRLEPGEVLGVEGHNGSGKSTLLFVAATLVRPTSGSVRLCGIDSRAGAAAARECVGLLSHGHGLYDDLTARENLRFAARMLGVPVARVDAVLERVRLAGFGDEPVGRFSSGMQRRISLGRLMLRLPRVLLLDEPYNSFDPAGIALVNELVAEVAGQGGGAVMVLHDRGPAGSLLDRVVTLREGRCAGEPPDAADRRPPAERVLVSVAAAGPR